MTTSPLDSMSPSGSPPYTVVQNSTLQGNLNSSQVFPKMASDDTDLKSINVFLTMHHAQPIQGANDLNFVAHWLVSSKEYLTSETQLHISNLEFLSVMAKSLANLSEREHTFKPDKVFIDTLFEIFLKYMDIQAPLNALPADKMYKLELAHHFQRVSSSVTKGQKPVQYIKLFAKASAQFRGMIAIIILFFLDNVAPTLSN